MYRYMREILYIELSKRICGTRGYKYRHMYMRKLEDLCLHCPQPTSAAVEKSFLSADLALAGAKESTKEITLNNKITVSLYHHLL